MSLSHKMKNKLSRPSTILLIVAGMFILNILIVAQTSSAAAPSANSGDSFESAAKIVGYVTSFITLLVLIAGIIWYAVSGKNREQLKDNNAALKDALELKRTQLAEAKTTIAEKEAHIRLLEMENDSLERKNLRLQQIDSEKR